MTIHQKRNHTMQNSMDTNWAVTKPLTYWYTIYILMLGGSIGVPSYFTSCEESALGTDSSWNYCLVVRYWGKAPKIPEKPRASLPWTIGEKSFPKKKLGQDCSKSFPNPERNPVQKSAVWWMIYAFLSRETLYMSAFPLECIKCGPRDFISGWIRIRTVGIQ